MLRFLASTVITLVGNAIGLLVAAIALPGFVGICCQCRAVYAD